MKRIVHIISGLKAGGAEMMLFKLLSVNDNALFSYRVISLTEIGPIGKRLQDIGIPVTALKMRPGLPDPRGLFRLVLLLRKLKPDLVQTWMYHADLMGGIAAWMAGGVPVIWNIRHSSLNKNKRSTVLTACICALLSKRFPTKIICCARNSLDIHAELGYDKKKMLVIPNGFELEKFRPDSSMRYALREELNVSSETCLIGMVGRFHPQKDHRNFIEAAIALHSRNPKVHYVLCGEKNEWDNVELAHWIEEANMGKFFHLLGPRNDINKIIAGLDIASLSSSAGEGFPNVIGEAMACGVPCVVTDVGDSAYIVGDTGIVVPPKDPILLAEGWEIILSYSREKRLELGRKARKRIVNNFDLKSIACKYQDLWTSIISNSASY